MKTKKENLKFWIILIIIISIVPCIKAGKSVYSFAKEQYFKSVAVKYINEKYGFKAQKRDIGIWDWKKCAVVYLEKDDRDFEVVVDKKAKACYDSYQLKEIEDSLLDYIAQTYPGGNRFRLNISNCVSEEDYGWHELALGMDTRFDGSNLMELLSNCEIEISMYYADTEFTDCELFRQLQEWNAEGSFISFDSQEHIDEYFNYNKRRDTVFHDETYMKYASAEYYEYDAVFAPYIKQIWLIGKDTNHSTNYELKKADGFLYWSPTYPEMEWKKTGLNNMLFDNSDFTKEDMESYNYSFDWGGKMWDIVYVYIPVSEVPRYEELIVINNGSPRKLERFGDYVAFELNYETHKSWHLELINNN